MHGDVGCMGAFNARGGRLHGCFPKKEALSHIQEGSYTLEEKEEEQATFPLASS